MADRRRVILTERLAAHKWRASSNRLVIERRAEYSAGSA
jgi:hypothetical protein